MFKILLMMSLITPTLARDIGKVIFVKGRVTISHENKKTTVKKDFIIQEKSTFETFRKSLVVISLKDGSKIKLNELSKLAVSVPKDKRSPTKTGLYKGSSFFKVIKNKFIKRSKFIVKTKNASLGVRGTQFFVSYGKKVNSKDSWMCVNEGLVSVRPKSSKKEVLVKSGEGVHIKDNKNLTPPKSLPWTKKLNWSFDRKSGKLENTVRIEDAYKDILGQDYD
jgi:hypothetical protein